MLHAIEPAAAPRRADEIGALLQQLRHRIVEATHQRAVDEEVIGVHGIILNRRCGREAHKRTTSSSRKRDAFYAATTSSLMTWNLTRSMRPKLVVSATSAASRPVPIRMRPIRG